MKNKPCIVEPLVSTKYCKLSVCPHCNIVNLALPGRITLQFDTEQFIEIAHAFSKSAKMVGLKAELKSKKSADIIALKQTH